MRGANGEVGRVAAPLTELDPSPYIPSEYLLLEEGVNCGLDNAADD